MGYCPRAMVRLNSLSEKFGKKSKLIISRNNSRSLKNIPSRLRGEHYTSHYTKLSQVHGHDDVGEVFVAYL